MRLNLKLNTASTQQKNQCSLELRAHKHTPCCLYAASPASQHTKPAHGSRRQHAACQPAAAHAMRTQTVAVSEESQTSSTAWKWQKVAPASFMVCTGFAPYELQALEEYCREAGEQSLGLARAAGLYEVPAGSMLQRLQGLEDAHRRALRDSLLPDDPSLGRIVLLLGDCPDWFPTAAQDALEELGLEPAIFALLRPHVAELPLSEAMRAIQLGHARHFRLFQPLQTLPSCAVPETATVTMNLQLDHGTVPSASSEAGCRPDASHVVVLDGMFDEEERRKLLAWLTAPEWDHTQGPPDTRWERSCVDREGDSATWGLRHEVLRALRHDPPPQVLALQSRLVHLYPEFDIGYMPGPALESGDMGGEDEEEGGDEGELALTSFVGNAVTAGDTYSWHLDADPEGLPPDSPWREHYGGYVNREPLKPLFVSALIYLDGEWPEDYDAETLFLDPATATGVFVRPAPGRMVLMDQDMPHRISAPSIHAGRPRYSLVWKLVFFPRPSAVSDGEPAEELAPLLSSISRSEWGPPVRFGSAAPGSGIPAVPRKQ